MERVNALTDSRERHVKRSPVLWIVRDKENVITRLVSASVKTDSSVTDVKSNLALLEDVQDMVCVIRTHTYVSVKNIMVVLDVP